MRYSFLFALLIISLTHGQALALSLLGILEAALGITLGGNALINLNLNAGVLSQGSCTAKNQVIGISTDLLGLVSICACVTALSGTQGSGQGTPVYGGLLGSLSGYQYSCGACPANASPSCVVASGNGLGSTGGCACACNTGYYADATLKQCIPTNTCTADRGTLTYTNSAKTSAECTCKSPYARSSTTGQCTACASGYTLQSDGSCSSMTASQRARMRRRNPEPDQRERRAELLFRRGHKPAHHRSLPMSSQALAGLAKRAEDCPDGDTACPTRGGFLCTDTQTDLTSCGGCVGPDPIGGGENCLSIPGALNVQCYQSKCLVASCFKGWRFDGSRCV